MAERGFKEASLDYIPWILKAAEVAETGLLACLEFASGKIVTGKTGTGLMPLGHYTASMTGDGLKSISIALFHHIRPYWWDNDGGGGAVQQTDVGSYAYIKDGRTVTADDTGRTALGLILKVDPTKGVLVYSSYPFAPAA